MGDLLFDTVENWHKESGKSWGRMLDAGTGPHSLKWMVKLETDSWTAVTADEKMKSAIMDLGLNFRKDDSVVVGNWLNPLFCEQLGKFDTIMADYLFGSIDGFCPYTQDIVIDKLRERLNPGGRLYIIGMNPLPDHSSNPAAEVITEVRRARDSCIMLAGHRPYREYPIDWMLRNVVKSKLHVLNKKAYAILHNEDTILRQLRVAQSKLQFFQDVNLRKGMEVYLYDLGNRVKAAAKSTDTGRIPLSNDYIIEVQRAEDAEAETIPPVVFTSSSLSAAAAAVGTETGSS